MKKLSPHYRTDPSTGVPTEVRDFLDKHFLARLENLHVIHPKLLVVFSGANGVGKSHLARRIQTELKALVLENDNIKLSLNAMIPDIDHDERNRLTWQYRMDLYRRLPSLTPNGLVVRDGVIDWYYDRILPVFERNGYQLFVVGFDVSEEKRLELMRLRGDKPTAKVDRLEKLFVDQNIHIARFRSGHQADAVLTDTNLFDYEPVIRLLRARLDAL